MCPHCNHKTARKGTLQKHIKAVHEGQTLTCKLCHYKTAVKSNLQAHIKAIHEGQTYESVKRRIIRYSNIIRIIFEY